MRLAAVPAVSAGAKGRRTTRGAVDNLRQHLGTAVPTQPVTESKVTPISSRGRGRGTHVVSFSNPVGGETDVAIASPSRGMRGRGRGKRFNARASLPNRISNKTGHSDLESEDEVDEIEDDGASQIVQSGKGSQIKRSRSASRPTTTSHGHIPPRRGRGGARNRARVSASDIKTKTDDDELESDELEEEDPVVITTSSTRGRGRGRGRGFRQQVISKTRKAATRQNAASNELERHSPLTPRATEDVQIRGRRRSSMQLTPHESHVNGEELTEARSSPTADSDRGARGGHGQRGRGGPLGKWKGWVMVSDEDGILNPSNIGDTFTDGDALASSGGPRVLGRKNKSDDAPAGPPPPRKRIKLIHRVPPATYTHHEQIPSTSLNHPKKIPELLSSFYRLEDDGPDMTLEELEDMATEGGRRLHRIAILRSEGRLNGPLQGPVKRQVEPPRPTGPWDNIIEQAIAKSKANREAGRAHVNISRRIARMITAHWEKAAGADDKERKAEERRLNALAKTTLKAVLSQWKEAVKVRVMIFLRQQISR